MKMISKLIYKLKQHGKDTFGYYVQINNPENQDCIFSEEEAQQLLSELEAIQWIPVSERLPEGHKIVLWLYKRNYDNAWIYELETVLNIYKKCNYGKPVYWQPLPTPPEEKE